MSNQEMPRIDMSKEFSKLSETDRHFVQKVERMNVVRATEVKALRWVNKWTAGALFAGVFGIYFYTIFSIKQEKFLDFEEVPEKSSDKKS